MNWVNIMSFLSLSTNNYWVTLVVCLAITVIILIIFEKYIYKYIYKILKKTPGKTNILERIWIAMKRPLSLLTLFSVAYIILLQFPFTIAEFKKIDLSYQTIVTFIFVYGINEFFNTFKHVKYLEEFNELELNHELNSTYYTNYFIRLIQLCVIGVGIYIGLGIWGIDVSSVITTLGFISVAIAFSLRETFSNIFSGIVIVVEQTFKIGDYVENEKIQGTIENIGFRSTKIKTVDKEELIVPNSVLTNIPLNNKTNAEMKKLEVYLSIKYTNKDFITNIQDHFNANKKDTDELLKCHQLFYKQNYMTYKVFEFTQLRGNEYVGWKQSYLTDIVDYCLKEGFDIQYIGFEQVTIETDFLIK